MLSDMASKLGEAEEIFARKATEVAAVLETSAKAAEESKTEFSASAAKSKQEVRKRSQR